VEQAIKAATIITYEPNVDGASIAYDFWQEIDLTSSGISHSYILRTSNVFKTILILENLDFFIHYSLLVQLVKRFSERRIFGFK
jgi:hypothetical protein